LVLCFLQVFGRGIPPFFFKLHFKGDQEACWELKKEGEGCILSLKISTDNKRKTGEKKKEGAVPQNLQVFWSFVFIHYSSICSEFTSFLVLCFYSFIHLSVQNLQVF